MTAHAPANAAWRGALAMLALALAVLAYLGSIEFGRQRGEPIQIDELYFATCAARGNDQQQWPVAGCHDNKGPVIYALHQTVQLVGGRYALAAIKVAAYAVVLLLAATAALLAWRLHSRTAALAAAALLLQALAVDASHLALKTETVGTLFVLWALWPLARRRPADPPPAARAWFVSGLWLGLALLTRQTFALGVVVLALWLLGGAATGGRDRPVQRLVLAVWLVLGTLLPLAAWLLLATWDGRAVEALASLFVYPGVRRLLNVGTPTPEARDLARMVLVMLGRTPLLTLLFVGGAAWTLLRLRARPATLPALPAPPALLAPLLVMVLGLLLTLFVSPSFYYFHLVPLQILMAVVAAVVLAEVGAALARAPQAAPLLSTVLAAAALLMAAASWSASGRSGPDRSVEQAGALRPDSRGAHGYVLGNWPQFYVRNGLVPASQLMYPWAIEGAPPYAQHLARSAASGGLAMLRWAQGRLHGQLLADFARTPPRHIVVVHAMARAAGSARVADVPGFDDYLQRHCRWSHDLMTDPDDPATRASLFDCPPQRPAP